MPKISKKVGGDYFDPATDLRQGDLVKIGNMSIQKYKFIEYQDEGFGRNALIEPVNGGQRELVLASKLVKPKFTFGGKRKTRKNKKSLKVKRSKKSGKTRKSKK